MKRATVRDLRNNFPRVAAWIEEGELVEITRGGKVFARLVPPPLEKPHKVVKVDFIKQRAKTWGSHLFSAAEVAEMRAAELEGEEGVRHLHPGCRTAGVRPVACGDRHSPWGARVFEF